MPLAVLAESGGPTCSSQPMELMRSKKPCSTQPSILGGQQVQQEVIWYGFVLAALLPLYFFIGWEGAADLAEETNDPRSVTPSAMIRAKYVSVLASLFMIVGFLIAIPHGMAALLGQPRIPSSTSSRVTSVPSPPGSCRSWSSWPSRRPGLAAASRLMAGPAAGPGRRCQNTGDRPGAARVPGALTRACHRRTCSLARAGELAETEGE